MSLGGGGLVGSCVDANFPVTSRPSYPGKRCQMGSRVIADRRSRFEREWQIRVTPREASMTDTDNVTVARFGVTAERGFLPREDPIARLPSAR